ncbi:MAG TPA: carbamoyltransferase HypF [Candidatus Methylomirabilis sp.]|nr:carbamoyltransferase HypF [Candidatus Methylomirabilis sp.]
MATTLDGPPVLADNDHGAAVSRVRFEIRVEGIVQGVGFRPFVFALASRFGVAGTVANDGAGVTVDIEGAGSSVDQFMVALERDAPPLALVERVTRRELPVTGATAFVIARSEAGLARATLVSPDAATCDDCLRELLDPRDRRFRYPFINCTNCGPRFTIIRDVPYDRAATTMAGFAMCRECAREYHDPADRRFHAQPVACPACGPTLAFVDASGRGIPGDPVESAARAITAGNVVAVKGLGGYHLAVAASDERAVAALRARKHREEKPFALMAREMEEVRRWALVEPAEERLLVSAQRPIVVLSRRPEAGVAPSVTPGNRSLGFMLPYTPVHHLLARALHGPIVLTSGNVSDEPIAFIDDEARARLAGIADFYLTHDRPIHIRTDDSVVRAFRGAPMLLRRSRGYAPRPIMVAAPFSRHILACGGELKNTVCVAKGHHAFVSHHIGDLENYEALRSFQEAIAHLERLFDVTPAVVAHDLHPEYLSTKWAQAQEGVRLVGIQHHHAHVVACLVDNAWTEPAIGVAFDGLGYGADGTLWGGEFLVADLGGFARVGHLTPIAMPGGTAAIKEPWRMAAVYLDDAFAGAPPALPIAGRYAARWETVRALARSGVASPRTSSAGRLFDAVSALLDVRHEISYEGQAAVELEQLADLAETSAYAALPVESGEGFQIHGADLIRATVEDLRKGVAAPVIAARFHNGVAQTIVEGCRAVRARTGLDTVALSGGVFQNVLLLERAVARLESERFRVLCHRQVPTNDGGLCLGQAVIANRAVERDGSPDAQGNSVSWMAR